MPTLHIVYDATDRIKLPDGELTAMAYLGLKFAKLSIPETLAPEEIGAVAGRLGLLLLQQFVPPTPSTTRFRVRVPPEVAEETGFGVVDGPIYTRLSGNNCWSLTTMPETETLWLNRGAAAESLASAPYRIKQFGTIEEFSLCP